MPRSARLDIPGVLQHVIIRGIERCDIFRDDQDRSMFLERLFSLLQQTSTRCYAWSLMSNHAHLLLQPMVSPLSRLMRSLLTGYAVSINRKYQRSGHLFQNRYKSIICEEEPYLLELVRYIHLNPLRAGLVATIDDLDRYPWSGHAVLMGCRCREGQQTAEILERFGDGASVARRNYRQFVADGVSLGNRQELVRGGLRRGSRQESKNKAEGECFDPRVLGSSEFVDKLRESERLRERIGTMSLTELVGRVCEHFRLPPETVRHPSKARVPAEARGVICYLAVRGLGFKGQEVGRELYLGSAGVSIAIRRGERVVAKAPGLKEYLLR